MSTGNQDWAGILQEFVAQGIPCFPSTDENPEPWLSVKAASHLLGVTEPTIQRWMNRAPRHPIGRFFRLSVLLKAAEEKNLPCPGEKESPKRGRKRGKVSPNP